MSLKTLKVAFLLLLFVNSCLRAMEKESPISASLKSLPDEIIGTISSNNTRTLFDVCKLTAELARVNRHFNSLSTNAEFLHHFFIKFDWPISTHEQRRLLIRSFIALLAHPNRAKYKELMKWIFLNPHSSEPFIMKFALLETAASSIKKIPLIFHLSNDFGINMLDENNIRLLVDVFHPSGKQNPFFPSREEDLERALTVAQGDVSNENVFKENRVIHLPGRVPDLFLLLLSLIGRCKGPAELRENFDYIISFLLMHLRPAHPSFALWGEPFLLAIRDTFDVFLEINFFEEWLDCYSRCLFAIKNLAVRENKIAHLIAHCMIRGTPNDRIDCAYILYANNLISPGHCDFLHEEITHHENVKYSFALKQYSPQAFRERMNPESRNH